VSPRACVLVCAVALGAGGCAIKQGKLRPGLFIDPQNSRDPDPTRNFAAQPEENPTAAEGGRAPQKTGGANEVVLTAAATVAVIAAGAMPSLIWTSTFEENAWFERKPALNSDAAPR
jgi:hypothetical protein